ncbi:Sas10/Utp3/C1D family protein [Ceratobasidium sp. AG-Ba]|nr:Sas10/Utp3/C1D family protein [Ceratobasidium sp. AG-Ba]
MSNQLADKADDLASSIDELEQVLKPLLETPFLAILRPERPFYLRSRGVNPSSTESGEAHNVVAELDRVKGYFAKIKEAEDPAKRSLVVDGKVANRFIKHALSSAISAANFDASSSAPQPTHTRFNEDDNPTPPPVPANSATQPEPEPVVEISSDTDEEPAPGTWKAKKRAREADLANQRATDDQEMESDDSLGGWEETKAGPALVAEEDKVQSETSGRSKRPRMDPFAGYDQPASSAAKSAEALQTATPPSAPVPQPTDDLRQQTGDEARPSPAPSIPSSTSNTKRRRGKKGGSRHKKPQRSTETQ